MDTQNEYLSQDELRRIIRGLSSLIDHYEGKYTGGKMDEWNRLSTLHHARAIVYETAAQLA